MHMYVRATHMCMRGQVCVYMCVPVVVVTV